MATPIPVELDRCTPAVVGGLLQGGCPLPADWERGVSFQDTSCLVPTVMGECPTCSDLKPLQQADTVTFRPVSLITAFQCSTLGGIDVQAVAAANLDETADYALAREVLTGQASARDANPNTTDPGGNPSLQNTATDLGAGFATAVAALGCIEQAIADATGGRNGYLLIGPEIALALAEASGLLREAGRLITVTGTRVIVTGGFDGRGPTDSPGDESPADPCELWNSTGAPLVGEELYIYGTASVWAGVGVGLMRSDIDRANNTAAAREERIALPVFTPCSTFAAGSGITKAC